MRALKIVVNLGVILLSPVWILPALTYVAVCTWRDGERDYASGRMFFWE